MEPAREGRDDSGIIVQPFTYQGVPQWSPPEEAGHLTRSTLMNWPQSPPQWSPPVSCGDGQFRVMRMHRYSVMPQCSPPVSSGTTMTCCRPEMISRSSRNGAAGER